MNFTDEELEIIEDTLNWFKVDKIKAAALRKRVTYELGKRIFDAGLVKQVDKNTFTVGDL